MTRIRITEDKQVIYDAYQKALASARLERFRSKKHIEDKRRIISEKNKKYSTLSYKYFRMKQVLYGLDLEIKKLKWHGLRLKAKGSREGYKRAVSRYNKSTFSTDNPARFIAFCELLYRTIGLRLNMISFLLWANKYDFFNKKDFDEDMNGADMPYYQLINTAKKHGFIEKIKRADNKNIYSLNAIGKIEASKIDKFVKKIMN